MNDNRVPAGSPEGGQWAAGSNAEPDGLSLGASTSEREDLMRHLHDDDGTTTSAYMTAIDEETSAVTTVREIPLSDEALSVTDTSARLAQIASVSRLHLDPQHTNVTVKDDTLHLRETTMVPADATPGEALSAHRAETSHRVRAQSINDSIVEHGRAWGVIHETRRHNTAIYDPTSPLVREDFDAAARPLGVRPLPGISDLETRVPDVAMQPHTATGPRISNERQAAAALEMSYVEDNDDGTQTFVTADGRRADVAWNRHLPVVGDDDDARRASEGERVRTALRRARIYPEGHRGLDTTRYGMKNPTGLMLTDGPEDHTISEDGYVVRGADGELETLSHYRAQMHFDLDEAGESR